MRAGLKNELHRDDLTDAKRATLTEAFRALTESEAKGVFGPETARATAIYQRQAGLADSGVVNHETLSSTYRRIGVLDDFTLKPNSTSAVDLNGDKVADIAHGEAVEAYLKGAEGVLPIRQQRGESVAATLENIANNVKSGELKLDALNVSQAIPVQLEELQNYVPEIPLTRDNLSQHKDAVISGIRESVLAGIASGKRDTTGEQLLQGIEAVKRLQERGVDVVVSAGNQRDEINALGLVAPLVGSTYENGAPARDSAVNSLVVHHARGVYSSYEVQNGAGTGYDITGDGRADFSAERASAESSITKQYGGQLIADSVISVPADLTQSVRDSILHERQQYNEVRVARGLQPRFSPDELLAKDEMDLEFQENLANRVLSELPTGVYEYNELGKAMGWSESKIQENDAQFSDYIYVNDGGLQYGFSADAEGRLLFNFDKTGGAGQLNGVAGTSLATPQFLAQKYRDK